MKLEDVINNNWLDAKLLKKTYATALPFAHIVMKDFIKKDILNSVTEEFPDLESAQNAVIHFQDTRQIKLAGKGMQVLSPSALYLNSYLQSDLFLEWLNILTGIKEPLISDPYLAGGGYHEIKTGGLLKVHADFNRHPKLELDRRLNLLIYLNKDWDDDWGGALQLFDETMQTAIRSISPTFNTAVIFSTTSYTYHGHPDPLTCPINRSRKSLAYYYFSTGRPTGEVISHKHNTLFKERKGEIFNSQLSVKSLIKDFAPPILLRGIERMIKK